MTADEIMGSYLQRLGFSRRPAPSRQTLTELVDAHLQVVPFENLDIVEGLRPELSTEGALHKVVIRRRGGFCYELNEAFGALLRHLDFRVARIEARVWIEARRRFGPPFDHLALRVTLPEGEFLTDVGFGDNNRAPMRFPEDSWQDVSGRYHLRRSSGVVWLLSRSNRPLYEMTLEEQPLAAFVQMHHYHQTSAESLFAQGLICTRATERGRITLSRERLIIVDGVTRTECCVADRDRVLEQYFDILKEGLPC